MVKLLAILCVLLPVIHAYEYEKVYLDRYCQNGTINLGDSLKRAGTLEFPVLNWKDCAVNITASANSFLGTEIAIYINFRQLRLGYGDYINIFGSATSNGPFTLRKSISGTSNYSSTSYPTSYDQVASAFSYQPNLFLSFGSGWYPVNQKIQLDWTIVSKSNNEQYCSALEGYIPLELKCEDGDRINCPGNFGWNSVFDQNLPYYADHYSPSNYQCGRWGEYTTGSWSWNSAATLSSSFAFLLSAVVTFIRLF